ncbi:damage-control phosphatase ARMT1 family protein [Promicromonospora sukumoe]|uniref:damage-control phosphatase ARMT1 family protein n=1 Tax=Promicromonospora sukumoe TaxID=88382 RepID=UPI0003677394|nr:damage-control phosphatase ARMT1 family protein [Promicromonospora sukumoe]
MTIDDDQDHPSAAEAILSNVPGSFPWGVLTQRHPDLIATVRRLVPYPPDIQTSLDQLLVTIAGAIPPLPADAHDHAVWQEWAAPYLDRSWLDVPFLWAESYFYRLLLEATAYFGSGPWAGIDPFAPQKNAELDTPDLARDLADLDRLVTAPDQVGLATALIASLWGNRADLGFRMSDPSAQNKEQVDDLVADDSAVLWRLLDAGAPNQVHLVADNAGRELTADLVLIDRLLATGRAATVTLHLKPHPYYVSDATTADLLQVLRRLEAAAGAAASIADRLRAAISDGRLQVHTHAFWCSPLGFHGLPADLTTELAEATVVIIKGDLNYRRLVGDAHWAPTSSFESLTSYFPAPLVALRTLKSDVAVGVDVDRLAHLEATASGWRTDGTHAVIHVRP